MWKILEIEPTSDLKIIKKAYAKKLREINPTEQPREYQALREAFEQAKKYTQNATVNQPSAIQDQDDFLQSTETFEKPNNSETEIANDDWQIENFIEDSNNHRLNPEKNDDWEIPKEEREIDANQWFIEQAKEIKPNNSAKHSDKKTNRNLISIFLFLSVCLCIMFFVKQCNKEQPTPVTETSLSSKDTSYSSMIKRLEKQTIETKLYLKQMNTYFFLYYLYQDSNMELSDLKLSQEAQQKLALLMTNETMKQKMANNESSIAFPKQLAEDINGYAAYQTKDSDSSFTLFIKFNEESIMTDFLSSEFGDDTAELQLVLEQQLNNSKSE